MFGASITRHIREAAKRFVGANEGNIAVIFTIAAIPIIGFVGAAIDYSRANAARSTMQAAMDSTALDAVEGSLQRQDLGVGCHHNGPEVFRRALHQQGRDDRCRITATYTANNGNLGNTIQLTAHGSINTDFMKVLGSNFNYDGLRHHIDHRLGQCEDAGRAGARQHGIDVLRRQDHRAAETPSPEPAA